jgi:glycosyltransferase involved in cell wall biosynthesis
MKGAGNGYPSTQVIIAALNEEPGIGKTLAELKESLNDPYVLVVDGKSTDRTVEIAKNFGAQIESQDGKGKGDALSKAFKQVGLNIDYVVLTDADYSYPAEYIPEMIQILEENPNVGMVCGNRLTKRPDSKALCSVFYYGNKFLAFTHNLLDGLSLRDPLTGLRVVRGKIIFDWAIKSKGFDIEVELNCQVRRKGYSTVEVPIDYRERLGQKKLTVKHGVSILRRILIESVQ